MDPDGRCGTRIEGGAAFNCRSYSFSFDGEGSGGGGSSAGSADPTVAEYEEQRAGQRATVEGAAQAAADAGDLLEDTYYAALPLPSGKLGIFAGIKRILGFGDEAAKSAVRILERDGNVVEAAFRGATGEARVITEVLREGDTLVLRGTHISGSATLREAFGAAREFGRQEGARFVRIEGGVRTTGANPGHVPRPITLETGL